MRFPQIDRRLRRALPALAAFVALAGASVPAASEDCEALIGFGTSLNAGRAQTIVCTVVNGGLGQGLAVVSARVVGLDGTDEGIAELCELQPGQSCEVSIQNPARTTAEAECAIFGLGLEPGFRPVGNLRVDTNGQSRASTPLTFVIVGMQECENQ